MTNVIENYIFVDKADSLKFKDLGINLIGYMDVIKLAKIDLDLPLIAKLPPKVYNKIINLIRNTICTNPLNCVKKKDLY